MAPWHERDDFWETFRPTMFGETRWESAAEEVENIIALAKPPDNASVLDLACGPGRHTLEFARRGFAVTAVDRTASYLAEGRERAEQEGLKVEWVEADMREFRRPDSFDFAVNLFTAFGYFEDPAEDRRVAQNLHDSVRPNGTLVMDLQGKERLARILRERDWREEEDGTLMLEERKVRPGWDWIDNRWILIKGTERYEYSLGHRLYSAAELSSLLREVGFASVETFGDLAGAPYDHEAKRLVAVARRS